jgi:hypothetical protein
MELGSKVVPDKINENFTILQYMCWWETVETRDMEFNINQGHMLWVKELFQPEKNGLKVVSSSRPW